MTFKKLVFYIAILALIAIVGYNAFHKTAVSAPIIPIVPAAPVVINTASYSCDEGKTVAASYTTDNVSITLSDGRTATLPHTVSADGAQYKNDSMLFVTKGDQAFLEEGNNTTYNNCIAADTTPAVNGLKSFTDQGKTFTLNYPQNLLLAGGGIGYTENWKVNTDSTLGIILATLQTPADYQPKTNLGNVKFSVGTSSDPKAVSTCLIDNSGLGSTKSTVTYNGIKYTKIVTVDAGAGNRYETTSYRTVQNSQCYAIEYTLHYAVLANFDPKMGISGYDAKQVHADFDGIVQSLKFLPQ